jgi:hypothetical protein
MAHIPGATHDLFVSYAHVDNAQAWVDHLVDKVRVEVCQRLGARDFSIFVDRDQVQGNRPITPTILDAVRGSALLMVVMSPGYLNSEWCRRERSAFLSMVKGRVENGSVFVVRAREVDRGEVPTEFGDLLGFEFFAKDRRGADSPLRLGEKRATGKIVDLSYSIKEQVQRMVSAAATNRAAPYVFVARSTEDLEEREEELRAYLSQHGIGVLPQKTWYPQTERRAFEQAMLGDLNRCKVFAQLLSTSRGRELGFVDGLRAPRMQFDAASQAGLTLLQWRDRALDMATISDAAHRALLDNAQACGIEEFKSAVVKAALEAPRAQQGRPSRDVSVFVRADESKDRSLAQQVGEALAKMGVACEWLPPGGAPEERRQWLEENLRECDGVLLVYGKTDAVWVYRQLKEARKILAQRDDAPRAQAIFDGPPPPKSDVGLALPGLMRLDGTNGIDPSVLKTFVDALHQ